MALKGSGFKENSTVGYLLVILLAMIFREENAGYLSMTRPNQPGL
jgi:hypothetical protein